MSILIENSVAFVSPDKTAIDRIESAFFLLDVSSPHSSMNRIDLFRGQKITKASYQFISLGVPVTRTANMCSLSLSLRANKPW